MSTPTEPGWYHWRLYEPDDGGGWEVVELEFAKDMDGEPIVWRAGMHSFVKASELGGEWGARIPSPERLAALEKLAAAVERVLTLSLMVPKVAEALAELQDQAPGTYKWHFADEAERCRRVAQRKEPDDDRAH
jgi:hypothetical protein